MTETKPEAEGEYSSESELEYALQVYQEHYNEVSEQVNRALENIDLINNAKEVLENNKMLDGSNALLNIGGGLYVNCKITDSEKFITGIGAGLLVENDAEGADAVLKRQLERSTDILNKLVKDRKQIEQIIYDISYKIEEAVGKDV